MKAPIAVHFMSKTNEWTTPSELFDKLNKEFNFTLDPLNPPYGREIGEWIKKAYLETRKDEPAELVVCLIPARTDTNYWHNYIFGKAEVRFIKGRLKFGEGKNSAPFPSAIVIFRADKK